MPKVVLPNGEEAEVSQQELDRLYQTEGAHNVQQFTRDGPGKVQLWDNITNDWTKPLPEVVVNNRYLKKKVYKCSKCNFTTMYNVDAKKHLDQVAERKAEHAEATVEFMVTPQGAAGLCTGCGATFISKPNQAKKHIEMMKGTEIDHEDAEFFVIRQYALSP